MQFFELGGGGENSPPLLTTLLKVVNIMATKSDEDLYEVHPGINY